MHALPRAPADRQRNDQPRGQVEGADGEDGQADARHGAGSGGLLLVCDRRRQPLELRADPFADHDAGALDAPLRDPGDRPVIGTAGLGDFLPAAGALHPLEVRNDG